MRVAMVCLGNICRSPMAAAVARAQVDEAGLGGHVSVESFGTAGYHRGEKADPRAAAALRRRGMSADDHRARQITVRDLEQLDMVLCADRNNLSELRRLDPLSVGKIELLRTYDPDSSPGNEEVPDPYYGDDSDFDHALDLIEAACRGLVERLALAGR